MTARPPVRFDLAVAAVVLACGALFAILVPPLGGFDEPLHFLRAWQVSDGRVFPTPRTTPDGFVDLYARVPKSLPGAMQVILRDGALDRHDAQFALHHLDDPAPHGPLTWEGVEGAGAYSPLPYLPSAVAIRVGRALGLSTLALIELARLAQVIVYAGLVGLAVRRIKRRAVVLAVLALAPVALIQAGTLSADALTIGLTLLVIAEAAHLLSLSTDEIGFAAVAEAAVALIALALTKPPYFLVGALLLLPMVRHGRPAHGRRVVVGLGAGMLAAGAAALTWNHWAQTHYVNLYQGPAFAGATTYAFHNVEPSDQTRYVRSHPWGFVQTVGRTLGHEPGALLHDAFAQSPSWRPSAAIVGCVLVLLAFAFAVNPDPIPGGTAMRLLGLGVAATTFVALFFLAYVGWNAVAAPRIDAFQGRYLLPVVAVLALAAAPGTPRWRVPERASLLVLGGSAAVALVVMAGVIRTAYF